MQIKNSTALKERVLDLWKTYLLSVSAQDMLLGEVSDHLYVGDVDFRSLAARGEKAPVSSYVDIGFSDDIGEMAYELAQGGRRDETLFGAFPFHEGRGNRGCPL